MWHYPKILAHRGGGSLAPENTLAALRCGLAQGFHAVEFDVMAARDGLVLMHDPLLGRTVAGCGPISEMSVAELAACDAGAWFDPRFKGEPVPSLQAVSEFCLAHRIFMNVEIKPAPGAEATTGQQVAAAASHWPVGSVLLSSFSVTALQASQAQAPELPRALLVEAIPDNWRQLLQILEAQALHVSVRYLTASQAAAVKAAGYGLLVYTVNDPAQAQALLAMGVDAICTDRIDLIGPDFGLQFAS
jgi:glycerophosphoryl diester phosphodiesterase